MKKKQQGFTLIELLVVIAITMILGTLGFVSYGYASANARNARRKSDIEQIRSALEMYRADNGYYPDGPVVFGAISAGYDPGKSLKLGGYISSIPTDPKDNATYPYQIYMLDSRGAVPHFYGYCLSAYMEAGGLGLDSCSGNFPGAEYTYSVKNP